MLETLNQSPAAHVQSSLLAYDGESLTLSHPLIVAIRAWLPYPQILDVINAAQRGYQGNAAADSLASVAEKCRLWWNNGKFVAV